MSGVPNVSKFVPNLKIDYQHSKRMMDIVLIILFLPIILSLLLLISICQKLLDRKGKIFYKHTRVGRLGKEFELWKFRTMYPDSETIFVDIIQKTPSLAAEWKIHQKLRVDPRITPFGMLLRKTSLDELPQFLNIIRGDMSLVGPRPITHAEILKYGNVYPHYIKSYPGLTGLWQVSGRNNLEYSDRVKIDKYYLTNCSFFFDFKILLKTPWVVLLRKGAC